MAYHSYLSLFIILLSCHQFIQTFAGLVDIEGSSYKLSTEIQYAIYDTLANDYLIHSESDIDATCDTGIFNYDVTISLQDNSDSINSRYMWSIIETRTGYALRNTGSGYYLSSALESIDDPRDLCTYANYVHLESRPNPPFDEPLLSWTFEKNAGPNYYYSLSESTPIVTIRQATNDEFLVPFQSIGPCAENSGYRTSFATRVFHTSRDDWIDFANSDLNNNPDFLDCVESLPSWVFIPLSLPSNCESITTDPSTPEAFRSLTSQLSSSLTTRNTNTGSFEVPFSTPERTECMEFTTTFTRSQGNELSFGFTINYQSPELSVGGILPLGQVSADYSMDWTYSNEEEFTGSQTQQACITFPSSENICPPRTICERVVTTYVPPVANVEFTITAICDGNEYTTTGLANVDGIVRIEYYDQSLPLDCPYYTTNYNLFEPGTLQFCDTCNNDQICEICRDGYILLDGVCITESTCEIICGGTVRGGIIFETSGGLGPSSGGFCQINDEDKYLSNSCRQQLGDAIPIQETMVDPTPVIAPSPTDNTSNGEECVFMYIQCGGIGYNGPTNCCQYSNDPREWECHRISDYYSQCNPIGN